MSHAERAALFVADEERTRWHDEALWYVRERRDRAVHEVADWEALRSEAAAIKRNVLSRLPADKIDGWSIAHGQQSTPLNFSGVNGGLRTPRSVIQAEINRAGVTSKAGLNA